MFCHARCKCAMSQLGDSNVEKFIRAILNTFECNI